MIGCTRPNSPGPVSVIFTVADSTCAGRSLSVVGDFNGWDPGAARMSPGEDGCRATVAVEPGRRYRFRYLAENGDWFNDECAHDYVENEYGGADGVLDLSHFCDAPIEFTEQPEPETKTSRAGARPRSPASGATRPKVSRRAQNGRGSAEEPAGLQRVRAEAETVPVERGR